MNDTDDKPHGTPRATVDATGEHAFGEAPPSPGAPPMVVLPERKRFAERAQRLHQLADRLPEMADYLRFMASVVEAQHRVAMQTRPSLVASAEVAIKHGVPPLAVDGLWRDMPWNEDLEALIAELDETIGEAQRGWFEALKSRSLEARREIVAALVEGRMLDAESMAMAPLVGAALQIAWTRQARLLSRPPGRPSESMRMFCPCCGSPAVASVIQIGMARSKVRYLHCGLCATEWYAERARCVQCGDSKTLDYCGLEDESGERVLPVNAETCDNCASYLKVMQREWEAGADPVADDLASLALDMMIADRDLARRAFNPLLVLGEPAA